MEAKSYTYFVIKYITYRRKNPCLCHVLAEKESKAVIAFRKFNKYAKILSVKKVPMKFKKDFKEFVEKRNNNRISYCIKNIMILLGRFQVDFLSELEEYKP